MDIIEQLIKSLEEAKAELTKNANCAPGAELNMAKEELEKDAANPALAPKQVKVKQLQAQIDAGTYKPNAKAIADKMLKEEELSCSENGQWKIMEKSVYNAGTHPMKGRESRVGNFPHYDYDTSVPHEDNVKQAKAHFDKHKVTLNDTQFNAHMKQAKTRAEQG